MAEGPNIKTPQETITGVAHAVEARRSSAGAGTGAESLDSTLEKGYKEALALLDTYDTSFTDQEAQSKLRRLRALLVAEKMKGDADALAKVIDQIHVYGKGDGSKHDNNAGEGLDKPDQAEHVLKKTEVSGAGREVGATDGAQESKQHTEAVAVLSAAEQLISATTNKAHRAALEHARNKIQRAIDEGRLLDVWPSLASLADIVKVPLSTTPGGELSENQGGTATMETDVPSREQVKSPLTNLEQNLELLLVELSDEHPVRNDVVALIDEIKGTPADDLEAIEKLRTSVQTVQQKVADVQRKNHEALRFEQHDDQADGGHVVETAGLVPEGDERYLPTAEELRMLIGKATDWLSEDQPPVIGRSDLMRELEIPDNEQVRAVAVLKQLELAGVIELATGSPEHYTVHTEALSVNSQGSSGKKETVELPVSEPLYEKGTAEVGDSVDLTDFPHLEKTWARLGVEATPLERALFAKNVGYLKSTAAEDRAQGVRGLDTLFEELRGRVGVQTSVRTNETQVPQGKAGIPHTSEKTTSVNDADEQGVPDHDQISKGINQMTMEGLPDDDEVTEPAATAVPRTDLSEPQRIETPPDDAWERPVGFGSDDGDDEKSASAQPPKEPPAPAASTTVAQNGGETAETPPVKQDDAVEDAWRASLNDTKREAVEKNKEKGKKSKTKIKQVFKGNVTIGVLGDNSGSVHVEQTTGATGSAPVSGGAEAIRESGNREQNTAPAQETGEENSRVDQGDNVPKGTEATAQPTGAQEGAKIDLGETDDQVDILNARHENIKAGFEVDGKDEGAEAGIERGPQTPRERYKVYLNELREAESRYLRAVSDNTQMNRALNEVRRIASFKNPSWTNEERQKRQDVKNELREAEAAYTAKLNEMEERRRERMAQAALHLKEARARRTREGKESTEERDEKTREKVLMARHEAVVMRRTANMVELARGIGDKKDMQTAIATRMGLLDKNGTILPLNHVPEGHAALSAEDFAKRQATWNQYEEEVGGRKDPSKLVEGLKSAMGWYRRKPAWARHGARVFIGGTIGFLSGGLSAAAMASSRAVGGIGGGMAIMLGVSGIHHGAEKFTTSRSKKLIEGHEGTLADRQQKYLGYRKQERVIKRTATGVGALGAFAVGAEAGEIASDMVSASHVGAGSLSWSGYKPDIDINTGDYEAGQGTVRAATNLVNTPGRMWDWGKGQLGFGEQGPSGAGKVVGPGPETAPKAEPEQGVTEQGPEPKAAPEPEAKPGLSESGAERIGSQEKIPIFDTSEKYVEWLDKHELVGAHSKGGISFVDPETNKLAYVCNTTGSCTVLDEVGKPTKAIPWSELPAEYKNLQKVWLQQEAVHVHSADRATYSYEKTPSHLRAPHEIDDTGKVTKWEDTAPTTERATSLAVEGTYKPGESVERVLQDKISDRYPDLSTEELGKVAHRVRLELMKDGSAARAFGATGDNWQTVGRGGSYDFDLDRSIVDREISAVRGQVPGETPVTKATAVPTETTATAQEPPVRAGHRADSFPYVDSESAQKALNELSALESGQPGRVWQEMKYLVDHHSGARKVLSPWMEPPFRGALERLGDVRVSDLQDSVPGARGMSVVVSPELERVLRSGLNALRSAAGADSEYLGPKSTMTLRDAVHETFTRNGGRPDHLGQVALKDPTGAPQTLEGTQPERAPGAPNSDDLEHRNFDAVPQQQLHPKAVGVVEQSPQNTASAQENVRYVQRNGNWYKETTRWDQNTQPHRSSLDTGRTSIGVPVSEVPPQIRAEAGATAVEHDPGLTINPMGKLPPGDWVREPGTTHWTNKATGEVVDVAKYSSGSLGRGIEQVAYTAEETGSEVQSLLTSQPGVIRDPVQPERIFWHIDEKGTVQRFIHGSGDRWTPFNGEVPEQVRAAAQYAVAGKGVGGGGAQRNSFEQQVAENRARAEAYKRGLDSKYGRSTQVDRGNSGIGRREQYGAGRGGRSAEYGPDLIRNRGSRGDVVVGVGGEARGRVPIGGSTEVVVGGRAGAQVSYEPGRTARLPGYPPEAALRSTYGDLVRELRQDFSYAPGLEDNEIEAFKRLPVSAAELAREPHTPEVQEALRNAGLDDKAHDLARYIRHYMGYSQGAEPVEARAAAGARGPVPFSGGIDANKTQAYDYVAGAKANSARVIPTEAARRAGRYRSSRFR